MEIKGPLSDLNLGGDAIWSCSESTPTYSLTSSFSVFRHESYSLLDFSFALFGNRFETSRNIEFRILHDLNGKSILLSSFSLSFTFPPVCQFKLSFSFSLSSSKISFVKSTIRPCKLSISMLQTPNLSSKPILIQLTNIYLLECQIIKNWVWLFEFLVQT